LDLLAAGIVVFALLLASYSTRNTWIALGSMAISMAALLGFLFLYTASDSGPMRASLTALAKELPAGWDKPVLDLAATLERTSTAVAQALSARREPIQAASTTGWFGATAEIAVAPESPRHEAPRLEPATPASATSEPPTRESPTSEPPTPESAIQWFLDEPPPPDSKAFLIDGLNASDQPLEAVQAVLKPDSGAGELELVLEVEGGKGGAVIPPGERFSLAAETLTEDEAKQLGGAILSVAYVQAGRRKTSIMYLTPPMLAQRAKGD
jgi:hypothetical protein